MQERFIFEENNPELINIQVSKNITADASSKVSIADTPNPAENNIKSINKHYGVESEHISHPTNYKIIMQNQQKDKELEKNCTD